MSTHKHIDKICAGITAFTLLLTILFANGEALGLQAAERTIGYETRLFDTSRVHTIDIVMDDWDGFIETCENEEYSLCAVVIDGESYKNVALRAKGNTSLRTVSSLNSDRYSFKIEFDHYDSTKSYHGLDKLSLNNIIQDTTYMKDYLTYRMMGEFGVDAPLCAYAWITVNGEDWGLYLAVEGVEESFLQRNYGSQYGDLYKPDSMDFGGGRGNGRNFDMNDFMNSESWNFNGEDMNAASDGEKFTMPDRFGDAPDMSNTPDMSNMPDRSDAPDMSDMSDMPDMTDMPDIPDMSDMPNMPDMSDVPDMSDIPDMPDGETTLDRTRPDGAFAGGGMGGGGMGSGATLQYVDDDPDSYDTIFDNAKTDVSATDQTRLIAALKDLSEGENLSSVLDIDEVLRYFVVHNFVVNGDSYTGSMVHNYYLYEDNGQLCMIPWDYNLAFGTFQGNNASSAVNDPIDTPLNVTGDGSRPMADWITSSPTYTELYHQYFAEFLESVDIEGLIDSAATLIAPYVEKDPTKFYTYEEFTAGVDALQTFCRLRQESVAGQLEGTIPATSDGQAADSTSLVDTSSLTLSDMGGMEDMGGGMRDGGNRNDMGNMRDGGNWNDMGNMRDGDNWNDMGNMRDGDNWNDMGNMRDRDNWNDMGNMRDRDDAASNDTVTLPPN